VSFASVLSDDHYLAPDASCIPIRIKKSLPANRRGYDRALFGNETEKLSANLSASARKYLQSIGVENPDADAEGASLLWMHVLAIGYSPAYLKENEDGIRQNWPRIPLPGAREALESSAQLGHAVAALLDIDGPVKGVTSGTVQPELRVIGPVEKIGGGRIDPGSGDLDLTAGWGHRGKGGVVMPAKGKIVRRDYETKELGAIRQGSAVLGLSNDEAIGLLGQTTFDVFLNGDVCWRNVPENVWGFYIGGYQVIKKWLSYRERGILGRGLMTDEVREVTGTARRIAAILLLGASLNKNYEAVKISSYPWVKENSAG
jgi:hypothetical protein